LRSVRLKSKKLSLRGNVCYNVLLLTCGPGSVVGIATGYGLDGLRIESRWGRDFPHLFRAALGPTQPNVQWVPGLSWGKERPGREADPSPFLVPWSRKSRVIPLSPYGPYGLYRVSVSVQGCTYCTYYYSLSITLMNKKFEHIHCTIKHKYHFSTRL